MLKIDLLANFIKYRRIWASLAIAVTLLLLINISAPRNSHELVVAARAVPAGTKITVADVTTEKFAFTWSGSLSSIGDVVGKVPVVSVTQGEPMSSSFLKSSDAFDRANPRSVSVTIAVSTPMGTMSAGDRVDLYGADNGSEAVLVARRALVLAISGGNNDESTSTYSKTIVEIAVSHTEAQKIATVMGRGTFTFIKLPH